jgi:membrane carboxypeptidase/penicillin-binding protein PbpC
MTPASILIDEESEFPLDDGHIYSPVNYDEKFHGPVRLRTALANSYNVPAVKVLNEVGIANMIDKAHAMGITGLQQPSSHYGLSVTLGGGEVSLLDMTTAYATLANYGGYVPPSPVLKITDGAGELVYAFQPPQPRQVVDPRVAFLVTDILADNQARRPAFGRNNALELSRPAAVKTGTTSDWRDDWTIGYTPYMVVGVWAGNADNTPMNELPGSRGAAPLWREIIESVLRVPSLHDVLAVNGQPLKDLFDPPPGLVQAEICDLKSLLDNQGCGQVHLEYFVEGTVPEEGDAAYARAALKALIAVEPAVNPGFEATWYITSPKPGEVISKDIPIIGTALYNPSKIIYFKVEYATPAAPHHWRTMGDTHTTQVADNQLEFWYAGGLEPGEYKLRLVLAKPDGNWLVPYEVSVVVKRD